MWKRLRWRFVVNLTVLSLSLSLGAAASAAARQVPDLPGLKTEVQFWKKIFAVHSTYEVVVHDARHLDRIYSVLDYGSLRDAEWSDGEVATYLNQKSREEKDRIRAILLRLHEWDGAPPDLTGEERAIAALFRDEHGATRFLDAAGEDRLRGQRGLHERFANAIRISRRYLPEMERIFRREGLPLELTRLPFVESCFNVKAYSKVGAAGIWQFMPGTGRRFMTINDIVDERRDPLLATQAAARYLRADYEALGSWPLALSAYNHGRGGIRRAVETVGSTDLVEIVRHYRGPAFGFASRNFYAEFLAAVEIEADYRQYFGEIELDTPRRTESQRVAHHVPFQSLAKASGIDKDTLAELNPALMPVVVSGRARVPKGFDLRLPVGASAKFRERYAALPSGDKLASLRPAVVKHRVERGQTLHGIAKRYGTTVSAIQRHNKIGRKGVRVGQVLVIPRA